jgi:tight adherence protein B
MTRHIPFTIFLGLIGGALPVYYVVTIRQRRMRRLQHQLPDAFDLISRMMQAGRTFPQAMQTAAQDGSPPLSQEFGYCCDQQQLGMSADGALKDLASRNGLLELKIFVLAVSIHRQTGGNLSQLLEKLADVIRSRVRMNDLINALTSEARMQVHVLTVLPILALILMSVIRPAYAQELYNRPALLMYCVGSLMLGWFWMRRILNFNF